MSLDANQPTYERAELTKIRPTLDLLSDLLLGPQHMWDKSHQYIRKWKHEEQDVYDIRRKAEPLFGGLSRTLAAAVGMLFAKDPQIEWNASEPVLKPLWDNLDNAGTKGSVMAQHFSYHSLRDGLCILLTDFPKAPEGVVVTAANEAAYGLRPFVTMYARADALCWDESVLLNRKQLTQLTLRESYTKREGEFGTKLAVRYRDLRLVLGNDGVTMATWRIWEQVTSSGNAVRYAVTDEGVFTNRRGAIATELPVSISYTGAKRQALVVDPPLANVGYANVAHWRYATNLAFNREVCGFEQLVITGSILPDPAKPNQRGTLRIGPLVGLNIETGGSAQWIGPSGKGLEQLANGAAEKMVQMDQQGLGFLVPNKTVTATATEARIDSYAQLATLSSAAKSIQDAWNAALEWVAWYEDIDVAGAPVMSIQTDFESNLMDAQIMAQYLALVNAGFSKRAVLDALQAGGRIAPDADLDLLEAEWEGELSAQREEAAAKAQAALAIQQAPVGAASRMTDEDDSTDDMDEE
jgi:hypothetical protein